MNALEIGGRNLLRNTGSATGYFLATIPSGTNATATTDGGLFCVSRSLDTGQAIVCSSSAATQTLAANAKYTVSALVKSTVARSFAIQLRKNSSGSDGGSLFASSSIALSANTWTKLSGTVTVGSTATDVYSRIYAAPGTEGTIYIRDWKLESGNKATDWTPAPEDVAYKTDAIKSITRNGTTFTATRADGTTFTFTQQDNNTTALTSMTGTLGVDHGGTGNTSGTANRLAYYSSASKIESSSGLAYVTGNSTASTPATKTQLHLFGTTYGNTAANMISETVGLFSFGDGGPQITFDTSATPGGSQAGALIYTDNDSAATGAS